MASLLTTRMLYDQARLAPSNINEHVPTLFEYASKVRLVTEMGIGPGKSSTAFLHARPQVFWSYDIKTWPCIEVYRKVAATEGIDYRPLIEDVLYATIEETDLLFIDTYHVYRQLQAELRRHADKARRYIVLHDTEAFGRVDIEGKQGLMFAVEEFLDANSHWHLLRHYTNNNGLTILERVPDA